MREKYGKNYPLWPGSLLCARTGPRTIVKRGHKKMVHLGDATCAPPVPQCLPQQTNREGGNTVEKYGLSVAELEAQHVELLPDRIEMKRRGRRQRLRQDCDAALVIAGTGVVAAPVLSGNATCVGIQQ